MTKQHERANKAQETLEQMIRDPKVTAHAADFAVLACIIWFDLISERVATSPTLAGFVFPIIRARSNPVFDAARVSGWLVQYFDYPVESAEARVAPRETYLDPEGEGS